MIWQYLSSEELQGFIGEGIIEDLTGIIPAITNARDIDFNINKREVLVSIVNAFLGNSFFLNKNNTLNVLNRLPTAAIDQCLTEIEATKTFASFEEKINFIADNWNKPKYKDAIRKWAGLAEDFSSNETERRQTIVPMGIPANPYKTLKDYQMSVYIKSQDFLSRNAAHFVVQMPTGSGKTRTAMEIVSNFINSQEGNVNVIWLAHSEELCDQAAECFQEVWEHVARKELSLYKCWGTGSAIPTRAERSAFIVGGLQKLYSALTRDETVFDGFKQDVSLIIIDEAHKIIAPSYAAVVRAIGNLNTKIIGLTATPGRNMDDEIGNQALSDFFHNNSITINTSSADESVIRFLRARKVLSILQIAPLVSGANVQLTEREREYIAKNFDFPPAFLKKLGENNIRNIEILRSLERECQDGRQIIFFACSVEHSKFICSMLIYLGFKAAHVDGATDKDTRQRALKEFKAGNIQVICNFGVLSTGFDAPNTDVVCIARPTTSIVLYSQMIGRGLRGPAIGGTPNCKLINVKDNIQNLPDYERIFDYFEEYWS
jgi:superfamily II DNA or RNA helicase